MYNACNSKVSKLIRQKLTEVKGKTNAHIWQFQHSSHSSSYNKQTEIRKAIEDLNNTTNQLDLINIYRTLYPAIANDFLGIFNVFMEDENNCILKYLSKKDYRPEI